MGEQIAHVSRWFTMNRKLLSRMVKMTIERKCEMVRRDVISALESSVCVGTWRDYISRRELYSLVFSFMGIEEIDIMRHTEIMTVIKEEVKKLYGVDCSQIRALGKARGYRGLKKKETN